MKWLAFNVKSTNSPNFHDFTNHQLLRYRHTWNRLILSIVYFNVHSDRQKWLNLSNFHVIFTDRRTDRQKWLICLSFGPLQVFSIDISAWFLCCSLPRHQRHPYFVYICRSKLNLLAKCKGLSIIEFYYIFIIIINPIIQQFAVIK